MDNQTSPNMQQFTPQPGLQAVQEPPQSITSQSATASDSNEIFAQIAKNIIEQQEAIIGPIAVEQAKQIQELTVDWSQHAVGVTGNPQHAIDELVEKYKILFGQIAVQVSREASASILTRIPLEQHPKSLTD